MLGFLEKRLDLWLPTYVWQASARARLRRLRKGQLTHLIFLVCDHFEPRHRISQDDQPQKRLQAWQEGYAQLQKKCRADFGTVPLHTWFYPPHHGYEHLAVLSDCVYDGLGEVELHYHHRDDTAVTLKRDLQAVMAEYRRWGMLLQSGEPPRNSFGFIHGDWALCNSRHGELCGVNDELSILQELGCWADFTLPSSNECQTRKINSIYYGSSDPRKPKGHNWGPDVEVGRPAAPGLFLMQGPLAINWKGPGYPRIENAGLTTMNWGRPDRIQTWLDCGVHVKGRPDWLFIKLHAHGAVEADHDALFGDTAYKMHRLLNEQFNDGSKYRLHYVTARQAYNIAKAAEQGKDGNPLDWIDFVVPKQVHSFYTINRRHTLGACADGKLKLDAIEADADTVLRARLGPLSQIRGPLEKISIDSAAGSMRFGAPVGSQLELKVDANYRLDAVVGGTLRPSAAGGSDLLQVTEPECSIRYAGVRPDKKVPV